MLFASLGIGEFASMNMSRSSGVDDGVRHPMYLFSLQPTHRFAVPQSADDVVVRLWAMRPSMLGFCAQISGRTSARQAPQLCRRGLSISARVTS